MSRLDKIRGLIARSASPEVEEARTAAYQACRMMREEKLEPGGGRDAAALSFANCQVDMLRQALHTERDSHTRTSHEAGMATARLVTMRIDLARSIDAIALRDAEIAALKREVMALRPRAPTTVRWSDDPGPADLPMIGCAPPTAVDLYIESQTHVEFSSVYLGDSRVGGFTSVAYSEPPRRAPQYVEMDDIYKRHFSASFDVGDIDWETIMRAVAGAQSRPR